MRKRHWELLILAGVCVVYLGLCAYHLRALPGEWYGDISIENQEVRAILSGGWPWRFFMSAGPAYHYVVAGFAFFFGPSYETYKLASVVTGLFLIPLLYLLGSELVGRRAGLLAALIGAVSTWLIIFARLGSSPQILTPVLAAGSVYFLVLYTRRPCWYYIAAGMFLAGIGLFTYPTTFLLPPVILLLIGWQLVFFRQRELWGRAMVVAVLVLLPFALWFIYLTRTNSAFTRGGYVGSKIAEQNTAPQVVALTFGKNMLKVLGMFQWTGDNSFRTNVRGDPVLDPVSGVLMDIGLIWLVFDARLRRKWAFILVPIVILLMPSADPALPALEIPSASRALAAAPFIFLLAGMGLDAPLVFALNRFSRWRQIRGIVAVGRHPPAWRWMGWVMIGLVMAAVGYLNVARYFGPYAWGLPEHNQPWGWQIAQYIDTFPPDVVIKLAACCWGQQGQPEPAGIFYVLKNQRGREDIVSGPYLNGCKELAPGKSYLLIFPPNPQSNLALLFRRCFPSAKGFMHYDRLAQPAFYTLFVK